MKLVADAGGTKTDWRLLRGDAIEQFATSGFNPNTHDLQKYMEIVGKEFQEIASEVSEVNFYGASIYSSNTEFREAMNGVFPKAHINLNNDLVGSCRSLSADDPAFVGILGTGSAGCFYDGKDVVDHPPSLGYALGDEGSGAVLGKTLLRMALRKRLDKEVQQKFDETLGLTKEEVYKHVYRGDRPNAYMATFTKFLFEYRSNPQIHELINREFRAYFEAFFGHMNDLKKYPFHFSGSVAYYFGDYLRNIGAEMGYSVGRIVQSPIAGLALYHQNHG